jgi:hypothetical protein
MRPFFASLIAVCLLLGSAGQVEGGGIHIRYGPNAPEKLAAANILYYEGVLNLEHNHPIAFAKEHPFYTKMFQDPVMLDKLIDRWEAHEQRFEYWHNCLWKVLDGYVASHAELPGQPVPPPLVSPLPDGPTDVGGGGVSDQNGAGGGGKVQTAAVPEPSSGLLIVLGLLASGSWLLLRGRSMRTS